MEVQITSQPKLSIEDLREILDDIKCEVGDTEWTPYCDLLGTEGFYLQLRYIEPDVMTGDPQDQHGRKWYISPYSTKSEVVQTVLKACITSAEHMIREHFTYKGEHVFGPHFDVDLLYFWAKHSHKDVRIPKQLPPIPQPKP